MGSEFFSRGMVWFVQATTWSEHELACACVRVRCRLCKGAMQTGVRRLGQIFTHIRCVYLRHTRCIYEAYIWCVYEASSIYGVYMRHIYGVFLRHMAYAMYI